MRIDISLLLGWGLFGTFIFFNDGWFLAFKTVTPRQKILLVFKIPGWKITNITLYSLKLGGQVHGSPLETISFAMSQPFICIYGKYISFALLIVIKISHTS